MKRRIAELDCVRAALAFAIIVIHTTSTFIFSESSLSLSGINGAYMLNQAARFGVPGFILLSGLSLSLGKTDMSVGRFYLNRLVKVVLPYLVWYVLYYAYNNLRSGLFAGGMEPFFRGLLTGAAAPHLYFIVIVCQLYVLYPLLRLLMNRWPKATLAVSFAVTAFLQTCVYTTCFGVTLLPSALQVRLWLLFPTWIFFFVLGMYMTGPRLEAVIAFARRWFWLLLAAFIACGALYVWESAATGSYDLSIKPSLLVYTPVALLALLGLGAKLSGPRAERTFKLLSSISMTVYFSHVLILMLLRKVTAFQFGMSGMLMLLAAVTVVSCAFSLAVWALKGLVKRNKRLAAVNGELRSP